MIRISTGCKDFDKVLNGGYERGVITSVYGPAGSGKTNLAILALRDIAREKKQIIYIDTESNFSVERLQQIAPDYKEILKQITFIRPHNFQEQHQAIMELQIKDVALIIVDSIGALYRLEGKESIQETNKLLGLEVAKLGELAARHKIPVFTTNQVYASFDDRESIQLVGGDITKYGSRCLIELRKLKKGRVAIIQKHRSLAEGLQYVFKIVSDGIETVQNE